MSFYHIKQKKKPKTTKKQTNRIWESPRSFNHSFNGTSTSRKRAYTRRSLTPASAAATRPGQQRVCGDSVELAGGECPTAHRPRGVGRARVPRSIPPPARRNIQRSQPILSACGVALGLGACTVRILVVMDAALFVGVANQVQLDSGLAMKLKDAAQPCGTHFVTDPVLVSPGTLAAEP